VKRTGSEPLLSCSFCFKSEEAVHKLISSPNNGSPSFICDECVFACNRILAGQPPKPDLRHRFANAVSRLFASHTMISRSAQ